MTFQFRVSGLVVISSIVGLKLWRDLDAGLPCSTWGETKMKLIIALLELEVMVE
jgi:hypothetical protein